MKSTTVFPMLVFASMAAAADVPSAQVQIAGAVLAAPVELREGAAVLGYDRALHQTERGRALADVRWDGGCAHHDQSTEEVARQLDG
jgi:hypothetical protein